MKRDYKVLELDKILELLASETSCEGAAKIARGIEPSSDLGKHAAAWRIPLPPCF